MSLCDRIRPPFEPCLVRKAGLVERATGKIARCSDGKLLVVGQAAQVVSRATSRVRIERKSQAGRMGESPLTSA